MTKKKTNKNLIIILSVILSILLIVGIVFAIIYFVKKNNAPTNDNNVDSSIQAPGNVDIGNASNGKPLIYQEQPHLLTSNFINNVGVKTGFISNIYSLVNNNLLWQTKAPLKLDWFKTVSAQNTNYQNSFSKFIRYTISDHNFVGMDLNYNNSITRIGHWNSLNFDMLNDKSSNNIKTWTALNDSITYEHDAVHAYLIAKLISIMKFDIIGLTEINSTVNNSSAQNFINLLNWLNTDPTNISYSYSLSDVLKGKTSSKMQYEKVCIIYNTKKILSPVFSVYNNPSYRYDSATKTFSPHQIDLTQPIDTTLDYDFVRPPYQIKFNLANTNNKIGVAFSHNDSPGVSKSKEISSPVIKSIGNKEYFEAQQIQNVLTELQKDNSLGIYMGDTNIPTGKQAACFSSINSSQFEFAFNDTKEYNSSLSTEKTVDKAIKAFNDTINNCNNNNIPLTTNDLTKVLESYYANQYDKIIYNKKLSVSKYNDLTTTFDNKTISNQYITLFNNDYKAYITYAPNTLYVVVNRFELLNE